MPFPVSFSIWHSVCTPLRLNRKYRDLWCFLNRITVMVKNGRRNGFSWKAKEPLLKQIEGQGESEVFFNLSATFETRKGMFTMLSENERNSILVIAATFSLMLPRAIRYELAIITCLQLSVSLMYFSFGMNKPLTVIIVNDFLMLLLIFGNGHSLFWRCHMCPYFDLGIVLSKMYFVDYVKITRKWNIFSRKVHLKFNKTRLRMLYNDDGHDTRGEHSNIKFHPKV